MMITCVTWSVQRKMVFYFTSDVVDPPVTLFMGLDKYENEDLIKAGTQKFVMVFLAFNYLDLKDLWFWFILKEILVMQTNNKMSVEFLMQYFFYENG